MRDYELMYILDPTLDEDATQALIGRIEEFMAKQGVTVEKTEPWGKRRLAYQIKNHWDGYYVLSQLQAEPGAVSELERRLRVTDGVLRFLTVRVDEEEEKRQRQREKKQAREASRRQRRSARQAEKPPPPEPAGAKETGQAVEAVSSEKTSPSTSAAKSDEEGDKDEATPAGEASS